jgi:hypothetical protein
MRAKPPVMDQATYVRFPPKAAVAGVVTVQKTTV